MRHLKRKNLFLLGVPGGGHADESFDGYKTAGRQQHAGQWCKAREAVTSRREGFDASQSQERDGKNARHVLRARHATEPYGGCERSEPRAPPL